MAETIFWFSVVLLVYIYLGYPLLLHVASLLYQKPIKRAEFTPKVTIVIPAYNEADCIEETIKNKLQLDYDMSLLEIIVVSDESTDGTDEIVQTYSGDGVTLIRQEPRQGKTAGLNRAIAQAKGEIIVFSDANSIYEKNALKHILANFSDPQVGYVTGKMVYVNPDGSIVGDGCSAYMKYENKLRDYESGLNSLVGVDGGIDAVRKSLYDGMRADQLPDFVLPLTVVTKGYRVVYEPAAILMEDSLSSVGSEYKMRVRVSLRAMWALLDMRHLLNPLNFPVYSWQLMSHKVLRYLAYVPMLLAFFTNLILLGEGIYNLLFLGQIIFYWLAYVGHKNQDEDQPFYITLPYYFVVLNLACAHAFIRFIKGEKQAVWNPRVG